LIHHEDQGQPWVKATWSDICTSRKNRSPQFY